MTNGLALSKALGRQKAVAALLALHDAGGESMGANALTAEIRGFSGSGIQVARHLEKHGLVRVEKKKGVADRPAYDISLTPTGQKVAEALANVAGLL